MNSGTKKFNIRDWTRANPVWKFALYHWIVIWSAALGLIATTTSVQEELFLTSAVGLALIALPCSFASAVFFKFLWSDNLPRMVQKLRRNELCPCGSGKKYKHCHYVEDAKKVAREAADRPYRNIQKQFKDQLPEGKVGMANRGFENANSLAQGLKKIVKRK